MTMTSTVEIWDSAVFPLALARWPIASENYLRTSDFLNYWPSLASGISTIAEK